MPVPYNPTTVNCGLRCFSNLLYYPYPFKLCRVVSNQVSPTAVIVPLSNVPKSDPATHSEHPSEALVFSGHVRIVLAAQTYRVSCYRITEPSSQPPLSMFRMPEFRCLLLLPTICVLFLRSRRSYSYS